MNGNIATVVVALQLLDAALDQLHASKNELVHAIYDVTTDRPLKLSSVSVAANADADAAAATAGLSLLARDVDHQRGTFPAADVLVALATVPGGAQKAGVQRLRLGLDEVDETLEGVDAPTGAKQKLLGNYGMLYRFALGTAAGTRMAVSPRGGGWGGVAKLVPGAAAGGASSTLRLPTASEALATTTDAIVTVSDAAIASRVQRRGSLCRASPFRASPFRAFKNNARASTPR